MFVNKFLTTILQQTRRRKKNTYINKKAKRRRHTLEYATGNANVQITLRRNNQTS